MLAGSGPATEMPASRSTANSRNPLIGRPSGPRHGGAGGTSMIGTRATLLSPPECPQDLHQTNQDGPHSDGDERVPNGSEAC